MGTKQITSPKQNKIRMFEKSGSFDDAVDDFRSANPSTVWEYKTKRVRYYVIFTSHTILMLVLVINFSN